MMRLHHHCELLATWDQSFIHEVREVLGNDLESENEEEEELVQDGSPTHEKEIVDSRSLHGAKIEPLPNSAADSGDGKTH